jgi:hypothetical protein
MNPEDILSMHIGKLTRSFARADRWLGIHLRVLNYGVNVEHMLKPTVPFKVRLDALEPATMKEFSKASPKITKAFVDWFDRARRTRALRNDYIHGTWEIERLGWELPPDPFVLFYTLGWDNDPETRPPPVRMLLSELGAEVAAASTLFDDFMALQRRHNQSIWAQAEARASKLSLTERPPT